jgi:hypothetical protein
MEGMDAARWLRQWVIFQPACSSISRNSIELFMYIVLPKLKFAESISWH